MTEYIDPTSQSLLSSAYGDALAYSTATGLLARGVTAETKHGGYLTVELFHASNSLFPSPHSLHHRATHVSLIQEETKTETMFVTAAASNFAVGDTCSILHPFFAFQSRPADIPEGSSRTVG